MTPETSRFISIPFLSRCPTWSERDVGTDEQRPVHRGTTGPAALRIEVIVLVGDEWLVRRRVDARLGRAKPAGQRRRQRVAEVDVADRPVGAVHVAARVSVVGRGGV